MKSPPSYKFNLWGIPTPTKVDSKHKHPDKCDFCGKQISDEDYYYIGVDDNNIWACSCINFNCEKWLRYKDLFKKPPKKK